MKYNEFMMFINDMFIYTYLFTLHDNKANSIRWWRPWDMRESIEEID